MVRRVFAAYATEDVSVATLAAKLGVSRGTVTNRLRRLESGHVIVGYTLQQHLLSSFGRFGAGFDTINTADAQACGVWVGNSPDYGVHEVSSHAFAMALNLTRHLSFYDRDVRAGKWHYLSPGVLKRPLNMTVGILGLGRIGKRFAHIARETYGRVIACDPHIMAYDFPPYVDRVDMETLFKTADIISIHTPLNDETRNIVNKDVLKLMKPGSYLVNTARGGLIDEAALLEALASGQVAAAGLDSFAVEPMTVPHPFHNVPGIVLSPHIGGVTSDAYINMGVGAARNVLDVLASA